MALHCVHSTASFEAALLKVANLRGDADSVGAVVGQLAGAFYGLAAIPPSWIEAVQRYDRGGDIATKAVLLYTHSYDGSTPSDPPPVAPSLREEPATSGTGESTSQATATDADSSGSSIAAQ